MLSLQTFEEQVSAVMETLVEATVTELRRLLTGALKDEEEERQNQFTSLMEKWAKGAVEKILMILKVSMCEDEDGPSAEQRTEQDEKTEQKGIKPHSGREAAAKKQSADSRQKRKKIKRGLKPAIRRKKDTIYNRDEQRPEEPAAGESIIKPADTAAHESQSASPSEPEALSTEPTSKLDSELSEDDVQEDTDTSCTTAKIRKRKTSGPFRCPSCDKSFSLKCMMERHYLTHSRPHLCSECGKRFAGQRGLIAHSRRHTGEKLYKCSDCGTEFAYKSTFNRHMRQHELKKPVTHTCTLCESQFTGLLALQRHRCGALKKTFVCSLCPQTFDCRQSLADHENLHSGDRDFVCEICGDSFFSFSSLATHRVTHMQKENCCDVLGLGCSDLSVLKNHLSKHTGEKLFSCEVCGKGCSHQSALKHHMLTHTGERPYVCETCGKRCGHASALQNHMRIHTGKKPGQQPVCSVCDKKFRCMVNLKYHMSVHTGEKPYACERCDKKFSNPSNLKLHTMTHSGEKMYGCNICGRRFTQSSSLKLHRRIHTGEKPYSCVVCGKGFTHRADYKKHQRGHLPDGDGQETVVKA